MDIRNLENKSPAAGTGIPVIGHTADKPEEDSTTMESAPVSASQTVDPSEGTQGTDYITEVRGQLVEEGFEDADFFTILDTVIVEGNYIWEFMLFDRIPCAFRIRPDWVQQQAVQKIEEESPKTIARFTDMLNRHNLAGALARMGELRFDLEPTKESLTAVLNHIGSLPFVTINQLVTKLVIFDKLITVSMSPWAIENFTKPQSEK